MTTQELKQQIDKVLGNSIRCLLPSYWWKRLFNQVADRIEDVEQSALEVAEASKMPIVASEKELNKLDLPKGSIAAVDISERSFSECYLPETTENFNTSSLTKIEEIVVKGGSAPTRDMGLFILVDVDITENIIIKAVIDADNAYAITATYRTVDGNLIDSFILELNGKPYSAGLRNFNALLKEKSFYYGGYDGSPLPTDVLAFVDAHLAWKSEGSYLYIKGDSWERLAKESDLGGIEGGGGSESETKSDTITFILRLDENYNLIPSDEDKEHNKESFKKYTNDISAGNYRNMELQCFLKDVSPMCVSWDIAGYDFFIGGGTAYPVFYNVVLRRTMFPFDVYFTEEGEPYISPHVNVCGAEFIYYRPQSQSTVKDHNAKVFEQMNKSFLNLFFVQQTKNGSEIANVTASCVYLKYEDYFLIQVPSGSTTDAFKLTSDGLITQMASQSSIDDALSTTSQRAVQNKVVTAALNNKVDKVNGKQLSTEDFTSALKAKLEGLSNYDDTEIENAVSSLQTQLNTLVSGNASDAINSFNEIIAFLNGVKDSESLDSIIASIEQQIASKQDSISDLDTIRSNASLGATAIQKVKTINGESITGDGNVEIFTKAMHDELVENMLDNEEVYAAAVNDLNTRLAETNATIATEVSTRESLSNDVQSLTDRITSNEEVTATSYNELNDRIEANYQHGEETYATIASLAEEVTALTTTIVDNEEVYAAAVNDLLARIDALTTRIEILENA